MEVARPSPSHYNKNDVMPINMVEIIRVVDCKKIKKLK